MIFSMVDPNAHYWIGFHDTTAEGTFAWSDDSDVIYTNWGSGEPNQWQGTQEDCTTFWNSAGDWNDWTCNQEIGFICKAVWYSEEERIEGVEHREEQQAELDEFEDEVDPHGEDEEFEYEYFYDTITWYEARDTCR